MNFQGFRKAARHFNVLRKSDVAGSYHFPTSTVSFAALARKDIEALVKLRVDWRGGAKLTASQYKVAAKVLPLVHHEYTHFIDSTSTVWGLAFLTKMNAAYSCNDSFRREESDFWPAKEFADVMRIIALPDYYTVRTKAKSTRPWEASVTAGQIFDGKGRVTERTILFQRFSNGEKEPLVRSPISSASVLEASSMAQETALHMTLIGVIEGAYANTERQAFSVRTAAFLYNADLTEYSVCIHLVANALGTSDMAGAFRMCALLTRVCLNLTNDAFDSLAANDRILELAELPDDPIFSKYLRGGLQRKDLGTAFYLLTRRLPRKPDLEPSEVQAIARQAVADWGIDPDSLHARAISAAEAMEAGLRASVIEPIRMLAQCGLDNLRKLDPWSSRIDFNGLHLPQALLGDSTETYVLGNPASPLARRSIESIFGPLSEGELWVERFAEGCL